MSERKNRFKRIATKRVNNVTEQLRILGNLSNKSYYDYTEQDVKKMFKEIDEQLRTVKVKFIPTKRNFKL